jgi:hypothetical protein
MLAVRSREVDAQNARARGLLRVRGRLDPPALVVNGAGLAVGDQVLLRLSDARLDVQNGTRGVVSQLDPGRCAQSAVNHARGQDRGLELER